MVNFAGVTGDFNPLHVDHQFAKSTPSAGRSPTGCWGCRWWRAWEAAAPSMSTAAFVRVVDWKFLQPISSATPSMSKLKCSTSKPRARRHGLITWRRQLVNQDGIIVQQGWFETLVKVPQTNAAA